MRDPTPPTRGLHLPPIPAVLVGIVSVQGGAAVAKGIFPVLGPAGMTGMRISMAALLLLAFLRPSVHRFTRAQWGAVVPYGMTLGAMNLTFYLALARIPLGLAVTLEFLGPLAVAVVGSRRGSDLLWVALAAAGVVLLAPWSEGADALDLTGVGLALVAGACWAGYILLGARASRHLQGNEGVAAGMVVAALTVLPFTLPALAVARLTPSLLAAGLGVAVLSSALPYTLEMSALRALPSRTFGILMSLEPAVAALAGLVFLGEHLSAPQWVAVASVTAASAGSTLTAGAAPPVQA